MTYGPTPGNYPTEEDNKFIQALIIEIIKQSNGVPITEEMIHTFIYKLKMEILETNPDNLVCKIPFYWK